MSGPGLEKGKVFPGKPTNFMVDSTKTGPAPISVEIKGNLIPEILKSDFWSFINLEFIYSECQIFNILDLDGDIVGRVPSITPVGEGLHDVSYVPPPVGEPYKARMIYLIASKNNIR